MKSTIESNSQLFSNLRVQKQPKQNRKSDRKFATQNGEFQSGENILKNYNAPNYVPIFSEKEIKNSSDNFSNSSNIRKYKNDENFQNKSPAPKLTLNQKEILINDFLGNKKRINLYNPYNLQVSGENKSIYSQSFSNFTFKITERFEPKQMLVFD